MYLIHCKLCPKNVHICIGALRCHILTSVSGSQLCVDTEAVCSYVSQSGRPISAAQGNVNEQVAAVLLRLQDDMANVLHRLRALEVITVSQVKQQV